MWIHSWNHSSARGVTHELGVSCFTKTNLSLSRTLRFFELRPWEEIKNATWYSRKNPAIPGPSPQDLGIPIGQISSPSYASRTLAPSSQSMHSQNSRARSRSLSYDSSRSVRARPATAPAPTANSAVAAAAIPAPDFPDAGHQAAPDALDDGAGLGTSPQGGTANAGPASPGSYAETQVGQAQGGEGDDGAGRRPQLGMPIPHPIYTQLPPQSPASKGGL